MDPRIKSFLGSRARLQRVKNSKFATGWILDVVDHRLELKLNEPLGQDQVFEFGEEVFVQSFGLGESALFKANYQNRDGARLLFSIATEPKFVPSSEDARALVDGLKCAMKLGWFESVTDVLDISAGGMGLRSTVPVEKGEEVTLTVFSGVGEVHATGVVRYCRTIDGLVGTYRLGIEFDEFDRLNSAKWGRLLAQEFSTPKAA